jgi:hypothetical protein
MAPGKTWMQPGAAWPEPKSNLKVVASLASATWTEPSLELCAEPIVAAAPISAKTTMRSTMSRFMRSRDCRFASYNSLFHYSILFA